MLKNAVLVTGGTQRLGLAFVEWLLAQGYPVITTYRTDKPIVAELAARGVRIHKVDFSCQQQVSAFITDLQSKVQSLRAIVHNAAEWAAESSDEIPEKLMARMMQVQVSVPYQLNLAMAPLLMKCDETADIVHMTDYVQDKGSDKHIAYAASKAALNNLTLSFAKKLAPKVKVNSIAPALVMFNEWDDDAYKQKVLSKSVMQLCPGAGEAVAALRFLMESQYVTGRTQHLDGGRHIK